jgi:FkbM family methyltransferase
MAPAGDPPAGLDGGAAGLRFDASRDPAERSVIRFEYRPYWRADPNRRAPVTVDLAVTDPADLIAREIRESGTFFEAELLEHLGMHGPEGGVYVDVGANVGNHAVFFGTFLADHVVAVEPNPVLVPILTRNLRVNGIRHASVVACAAGAAVGLGQLSLAAETPDNIGHTQVAGVTDGGATVVPIAPLDRVLDALAGRLGARPVTCIKVDVEGMELSVLEGATRVLQAHRPQLVVELAGEDARRSVRRFLAAFGYGDTGQRFCWAPTYHFIDPRVHRLRPARYAPARDPAADRMRRMTDELCALVPVGATFIFVDQEQAWPGVVADGRHRLPFLEKDGRYWGPPADDRTAIAELERLRGLGATLIAFACNAFWWLDHYADFARYLRARYPCLLCNERLAAFALGSPRDPARGTEGDAGDTRA